MHPILAPLLRWRSPLPALAPPHNMPLPCAAQGAMWIHDAVPGNALYDLAMELGLPLSPRINYNSIAQYTPEGLPSNDTSVRQASFKFVTEVGAARETWQRVPGGGML